MRKINFIIGICALCCAGVYAVANDGQTETVEIDKKCLGDVGSNTGICTQDRAGNGSSCSENDTNANNDCFATYIKTTVTITTTDVVNVP